MKPIYSLFSIFTCALIFLSTSSTVIAQTKVVVIPLGGDAESLQNVITVAKSNGDFTDPIKALNSITDASSSNPYLIVIAPGVYYLSSQLVMKEYVSIAGSGKETTFLSLSSSAPKLDYFVTGANNTELSDLTIDSGELTRGLHIVDNLNIYRSRFKSGSTGIDCGHSTVAIVDSEIRANVRGIYADECNVTLNNTSLFVGFAVGSGSMYLVNSSLNIEGGSILGDIEQYAGVQSIILRFSNSLFRGDIFNTNLHHFTDLTARVYLSNSTFSGEVSNIDNGDNSAQTLCNFVFSEDQTPLNASCE